MYLEYFGFREKPFSIAPDPRYLYMSERHREALAHLLYGVKTEGGFVLLSGEVGTGKTTVCRCLLDQLPESTQVAFIINPRLTVEELLATICDEFAISYPPGNSSTKVFVDHINHYLLDANAKGYRPVLIIDEAQNLSTEVLEQIRLLTNLETNERKLLQIVLLGQPELRAKLGKPELRQLKQRVTASYHLEPLSKDEVTAYIKHRLAVAGVRRIIFPPATIARIYRLSQGIPRVINLLCDRALLGAYVEGAAKVTGRTLNKAASEIFGEKGSAGSRGNRRSRWIWAGLLAFAFALTALAAAYYKYDELPAGLTLPTTHILGSSEPAPKPNDRQEAEISGQGEAPSQALTQPRLPAVTATENHAGSAAMDSETAEKPTAVSEASLSPAGESALVPLSWPADQDIARSKPMAFQALFSEWGLSYEPHPDRSACQQARAHNLDCLFQRGNLGSLKKTNRPAVLRLTDNQGQNYFALLKELDHRTATMIVGKKTERVAIAELESHWSGAYTILWRTPEGYQGAVRPGYLVPWINWLDQRLAAVDGREVLPRNNRLLAGDLLQRVKDFQLASNLVADGIIGPQTIIRLNTAVDQGVPTIIHEPGTD